MIIVKKKGHNSQIYIARSNAAIDQTNVDEEKVYITTEMLYDILDSYLRKNELDIDLGLDKKQDVLVSGENIKTINGESILGAGDIELSTTEELTQAEYDELLANGQIEEDKLYLITDAVVNVPYPTYAEMTEYVDDVLGQIDEIMKDIIG